LLAVSAFVPQKNFRKITILIFISSAIGQIIYPWWYISLQQGGVVAVTAHAIRILTLLWATAIIWNNIKEISQGNLAPKASHLTS
jgi:hypothetical protein